MNVDPRKIKYYIPAELVSGWYGSPRLLRGLEVVNNDILQYKRPILAEHKIKYCFEHFVNGVPWHKLPIENAPKERYWQLDCLYREAKAIGHFRRIYKDNVLIHLIDGRPYFAGGGYHRLAIALILGLPEIPVDISLICTTKGGENEGKKGIS
jgi:hypothetical protein